MKTIIKLLILTMAMMFVLSACGQKGPLYLPDSETTDSETTEGEEEKSESTTTE